MEDQLSIKDPSIDPRDSFRQHIREIGPIVATLARKMGISSNHLLFILSKKRKLQPEQRQRLNEILKTDF